ncbi:hypothetical protein RB195_000861 [Necator americanus]|uniref:Uncharacterized protein n=1 Tax=Necator americanus TaxID=51031 RepID=A0ABR1DBN7_NECAM
MSSSTKMSELLLPRYQRSPTTQHPSILTRFHRVNSAMAVELRLPAVTITSWLLELIEETSCRSMDRDSTNEEICLVENNVQRRSVFPRIAYVL